MSIVIKNSDLDEVDKICELLQICYDYPLSSLKRFKEKFDKIKDEYYSILEENIHVGNVRAIEFIQNLRGVLKPMVGFANFTSAPEKRRKGNIRLLIREIFKDNFKQIQKNLSSYSFSDYQTREAMKDVYARTKYVLDPHGAVGYLGLKQYVQEQDKTQGIFLETAHPVKFLDVVEPVIKRSIPYPTQIKAIMDRKKVASFISTYDELKEFLLK